MIKNLNRLAGRTLPEKERNKMFRKINLFGGPEKSGRNLMNLTDFILNDTFSNLWSPVRQSQGKRELPLKGWSDKEAYYVEAQLPGLSEESIDISVSNRKLSIKATINDDSATEESYIIRERPTGKLEQVLTLGDAIDSEKIEARYHNGVLKIRLPKAEEVKTRKITINTD